MKIGAVASFFAPVVPPDRLINLARGMDENGLDSIWFGEHVLLFDEMEFGYPGSPDGKLPVPEGCGVPDQSTIIGYLAGHTKSLRFGTSISLIPQRNPIYTAKEFATLDWLTGGRVDLGVGVGWCKEEVLSCGYDWSDRGARCDEALALMAKLWRDPITDHQGSHFQVQGARMDPKPVNGSIPLIVGGFSDAALKRAATLGQGWLGFGQDPRAAEAILKRLDIHLSAAGRSRDDFDIVMMPAIDDVGAARAFRDLGVDRLIPLVMLDSDASMAARLDHLTELNTSI
ncbi:MAG: TIGR03619 family F420-dependent LLM class oxidoreductase [Pseudomonadales bacterium]|nr:TIGR03619 family F420-dependent LLM class oxidoreductase [Pseudomonadales bacterium]